MTQIDKRTKTGFTLIELIVTVVVIGILFLIVARPKKENILEKGLLSSGVQILKSDLKYLRNQALQTHQLQKIIFVNDAANYTFYEQHPSQNIWVQKQDYFAKFPKGITIQSTTIAHNQIIFGANGIPYEDPQTDLPEQSQDQALAVTRNVILVTTKGTEDSVGIVPETGYAF